MVTSCHDIHSRDQGLCCHACEKHHQRPPGPPLHPAVHGVSLGERGTSTPALHFPTLRFLRITNAGTLVLSCRVMATRQKQSTLRPEPAVSQVQHSWRGGGSGGQVAWPASLTQLSRDLHFLAAYTAISQMFLVHSMPTTPNFIWSRWSSKKSSSRSCKRLKEKKKMTVKLIYFFKR